MAEDDRDPYEPRPTYGCLLLIVPIVLTVGGVIAYFGMFVLGILGRDATGERVEIQFATCPEARTLIADRVALMGLGDPEYRDSEGGFTLVATLPADPVDAAAIPNTLIETGRLEIRDPKAPADAPPVIAGERVDASTVHLSVDGVVTLVKLDDQGANALRDHMISHPEGEIAFVLDGETVYTRSNLPAEARGNLEILTPGATEHEQMRIAAARSVILDAGPLPCPASLVD
jgi:hypothetical protein